MNGRTDCGSATVVTSAPSYGGILSMARSGCSPLVFVVKTADFRNRNDPAQHVFADTGFANADAEFEQFAVDARYTPERIFAAHAANELPYFFRH